MGKHWIVLVNKSPRGPLTFEEVSTLLSEKILSRTDLALKVTENSEEEKSEWKFLWQYPEFDLREKSSNPGSDISKGIEEKRASLDSKEVKAKAIESLPDAIAMINPEDLIISGKKNKLKTINSFFTESTQDGVDILPYTSPNSRKGGWGYAVLVSLLVVGGIYVKGLLGRFGDVVSPIRTEEGIRDPARVTSPVTKPDFKINNPPLAKPNSNLNPAPVLTGKQTPRLPDKSEISLEEYEKLKTERAEKDRLEEEDRRREREESEKIADSNGEGDEEEVAEGDSSDAEIELPLKRVKKKKGKLGKAKKRMLAEDMEAEQDKLRQEEDSNLANESEAPTENE